MSEWGTFISSLETIARAQFPRLRTGVAGFERDIRPIDLLTAAELPHVFAHNPQERVTPLAHGQEAISFSIVLTYAPEPSTTQEAIAVLLDNFRAALQADSTLGGAVERAWIRERLVQEAADSALKAGVLEVVAERVQ